MAVLCLNEFRNRRKLQLDDLSELASELEEQWQESSSEFLDWENLWWGDEIEYEFFLRKMHEQGVRGWRKDYVLYKLGY